MKKPALHPLEQQRLQALRSLSILDSSSEKEFDDITRLASYICDVPIAMISLVDKDRQWFKSKLGLDVSETHRDVSFCGHTILQEHPFVVEDALTHELFATNPHVIGGPQIRFYAGTPLRDPVSQLPIGTLCVIDQKARNLSRHQTQALEALARQIQSLLQLRLKMLEREQSNHKLAFYKTAVDQMCEGILIVDRAKNVVSYNSATIRMLELSETEVSVTSGYQGLRLNEWTCYGSDGSILPLSERSSSRVLRSGQPEESFVMGVQLRSGRIKWVLVNASPLFLLEDGLPSHVVMTFSDVTELRETQKTLVEKAKLSSLGEMAGGIAHEINTPLTVLSSAARQAIVYANDGEIDRERLTLRLQKIETTADRIAGIVRGMSVISRNAATGDIRVVSLRGIINETLNVCADKFKTAGVEIRLESHVFPLVICDPVQFSQVLLNLLSNAFDAVHELSERWVALQLYEESDRVVLRCIDSGAGIAPHVAAKIMQPFFTTKEIGKGTGLGLSISKSIIESFGGSFYYDRTQANTCFTLEFPKESKKRTNYERAQ